MIPFAANEAKLRRRHLIAAGVHVLLLSVCVGLLAIAGFDAVGRLQHQLSFGTSLLAVAAGLLGCVALWHLMKAVRLYMKGRPRVVPYFKDKYFRKKLNRGPSDESTRAFTGGFGIAADLEELDNLAGRLNISPLSHFGFGDDAFEQRPQWSALTEGIRTVSKLAEALQDQGAAAHVSPAALSDLRTLEATLKTAVQNQTEFSLLVRFGSEDFISGYEMERREGTFWCRRP